MLTDSYESISAEGDDRSCVPTAFALVHPTLSYREINNHLLRKGYRRPNRGVFRRDWMKAAKELGLNLIEVDVGELRRRGIKTTKSASKLGRGRWLIQSSGHLTAVRDGSVEDWARGRLKRIISAYRVEDASPNVAPEPWSKVPSPKLDPAPPRPNRTNVIAQLAAELSLKPAAVRRRARAAGLRAPYTDIEALRRAIAR